MDLSQLQVKNICHEDNQSSLHLACCLKSNQWRVAQHHQQILLATKYIYFIVQTGNKQTGFKMMLCLEILLCIYSWNTTKWYSSRVFNVPLVIGIWHHGIKFVRNHDILWSENQGIGLQVLSSCIWNIGFTLLIVDLVHWWCRSKYD